MNSIDNLLSQMTTEQKAPIVKILGLKYNENKSIKEKLSKILLPAGGLWQTPLTYNQFIYKIAEKNNEKIDLSFGSIKAETELYIKLFQQEFEKLSPSEKEKISLELEKAGLDKNQISSLSGITALGAAQLSGFGVYLLASSTVGAITSVLGITLPFAFYTGMSSVISFVIGPVGFLVMGVMIYRSFKNVKSWDEALDILKNSWVEIKNLALGDYTRGILAFKYLAATRVILSENLKNEISINEDKINRKKQEIKSFVDDIEIKKNEISIIENNKENETAIVNKIKKEIEEKNNELSKVQQRINSLNTDINNIDLQIKNINNSIENEKNYISNINNQSNNLNNRLKNLQK